MESAKTNINTIAKMAGVSTTTVSNFINCSETIPISAAKRERIMEAMRQTNYRPSAASSQLRRNSALPGKAVFIFGSNPECNPFDICKNPMLSEAVGELSKELKRSLNLSMEIRAVQDENEMDSWNETIADADAIVCYGRLDEALSELSTRRNIPLAIVSDNKGIHMRGACPIQDRLDSVYWDAASHLETLLEHLASKGARRFAFVSSWNIERNHKVGFAIEAEAKIAKFKDFIASGKGFEGRLLFPPMPQIMELHYEAKNACEAIMAEKLQLKDFDAAIGHNDLVALGIAWAMQAQGLKPGKDILLCGEGDYLECRHQIPGITTISYDKAILAKHVCSILKRRLSDNRPAGEHLLAPSHLMERESTGG